MEVKINAKYAIGGDAHSWYIARWTPRTDKDGDDTSKYEPFLYYTSLEKAVDGLIDYTARVSKAKDFASCLKAVHALSEDIRKAFDLAKEKPPEGG